MARSCCCQVLFFFGLDVGLQGEDASCWVDVGYEVRIWAGGSVASMMLEDWKNDFSNLRGGLSFGWGGSQEGVGLGGDGWMNALALRLFGGIGVGSRWDFMGGCWVGDGVWMVSGAEEEMKYGYSSCVSRFQGPRKK